ncbi:hypothetical protein AB1Y20_009689 [Prymnesium parvum]|uniref:WDR19 first beta-propeller domain-containing protein n=1 Tax=Prymnesium parvum TaxID=97485 RepID=A0AB34K2R5_PRYPA
MTKQPPAATDLALPKIGSLDLSSLRAERQVEALSLQGDHEMALEGRLLESPRAASDRVLATPRTALGQPEGQQVLHHRAGGLAASHGAGVPLVCSNGRQHASAGSSGRVHLWEGGGGALLAACDLALAPTTNLRDKKLPELLDAPPAWMAFDASGAVLGVFRPGVGLWLCVREGAELSQHLLESGAATSHFTYCAWSTTVPGLLAVGSDNGRVMLYSPKTGKLTTQKDGKHPGRTVSITCGDWLPDGRLAVASPQRLKVSCPIDENAEWATFSKFYIGKMVTKIPFAQVYEKKGGYDTTPRFVAVSKATPPYVAMSLGDKVVTVMDYSGIYREEGFFIPLDYGHIVGLTWTAHEVLIIGLSNGYIVAVSAPLLMRQRKNESTNAEGRNSDSGTSAESARSMTTTRVFTHYLTAICDIDGAPAVLGDTSLKILQLDMTRWGGDGYLSIPADIPIQGFSMGVGVSLKAFACRAARADHEDDAPVHVIVSATDGQIYCLSLPGAGAACLGV